MIHHAKHHSFEIPSKVSPLHNKTSVSDYDFFNVNINRSNILVKSVFAIITDSSVGAN